MTAAELQEELLRAQLEEQKIEVTVHSAPPFSRVAEIGFTHAVSRARSASRSASVSVKVMALSHRISFPTWVAKPWPLARELRGSLGVPGAGRASTLCYGWEI
jgi:hypothetical protein